MSHDDVVHAGTHPTAIVEPGTTIDPSASIGAFVFVGRGCRIEPHALVDPRVTIVAGWSGSRESGEGLTVVGEGASIGAGAVVRGPLSIGRGAVVEAGAVVVDDVPAHAVVAGNPAAVVGYTKVDESASADYVSPPAVAGDRIEVAGCSLMRLPRVVDLRGALTFAEIGADLPFSPERFFIVYGVPSQKIRGSHAHYELHELILAIGGSVTVTVDNGRERGQIVLDDPTLMLHLRAMTWTTQYSFSPGAALVVLASHVYEDADYIRDYDDYRRLVD
jgi:hypothetical protein